MMNTMLEQTLTIGTAQKARVPTGWEAAGKTGTSQDYRDAWFIGYTDRLVTGVWLGNDDNSPTKRATGGSLPVEIWSRSHVGGAAGSSAGTIAVWHLAQSKPLRAGRRRPPSPRMDCSGCPSARRLVLALHRCRFIQRASSRDFPE